MVHSEAKDTRDVLPAAFELDVRGHRRTSRTSGESTVPLRQAPARNKGREGHEKEVREGGAEKGAVQSAWWRGSAAIVFTAVERRRWVGVAVAPVAAATTTVVVVVVAALLAVALVLGIATVKVVPLGRVDTSDEEVRASAWELGG